MLFTLHASCLKSLLAPADGSRPKLALTDLPAYTKNTLGLSGLNLTTDLLAGADRSRLETIRERADKSGCACLLLIETNPLPLADPDPAVAAKAVERMKAVVRAAHILGCNSAALTMTGPATDLAQAYAVKRLKDIAEPAERLDLNVLIAPTEGLTSIPEKVTEIIKKVGGFRIGTLPDFLSATKVKEPIPYLRRLIPYASCVTAVTIDFEVQEVSIPKISLKPAAEGDAPPALAAPGAVAEEGDLEVDDEIDDDDLDLELEALADELAEGRGDDEEEGPTELFIHKPYDLKPLVEAVLSVGYDGSLGIDYRGGGDVTMGITRSREALRMILAGAGRTG
ncbi:MAG TPA: TIM barrel protein [Phycisphaerales bacterium]|nr:TIM barrel protein [Phycisphaerales bacterium]